MSGAVAGMAVATAAPASAKEGDQGRAGLVGTWALTVEFEDGLKNPTLISFDASGALVETNALTRSTGLGSWRRTGSSKYHYVFWEQIFDDANKLQSHVRVSHHLKIARYGDTYKGDGTGEIFDLNWQPTLTVHTTITARRLT
jgi:hypothetical protein